MRLDQPPLTLDPSRQEQARRKSRFGRRILLIEVAIGLAYSLAWLVFGWAQALKEALLRYTDQEGLLVVWFCLVFGGVIWLVTLPLAYYEGFLLQHRFGLSTQTLKGWIVDQVKGTLVGGFAGLFILQIIYSTLRIAPETWWLWAAGFLFLTNMMLAFIGPILLFPIFFKFTRLGPEYADLEVRLLELARDARTKVRGVYSFNMSQKTRAANAALVGLGATRRIILGDTLLTEFTPDEIETVLAHELAHQVHKDLPVGLLIETAMSFGAFFLAKMAMDWGVSVLGLEGVGDIAGLPLFTLVMAVCGLVTFPLFNFYSRWREAEADAYAVRVTGKGEAFASAMTRLANQNLADADPHPLVEFLFHSHPALSKRIEAARTVK